jgi:transcriptional regulator with XRE-family HTH domain
VSHAAILGLHDGDATIGDVNDGQDELAHAFGAFVRAQRQLANISQRQLGRLSGISDSYLSQMERGLYRPSPEVMRSLAKAFGMKPAALYAQFGLLDEDEAADGGTQSPRVEEAIRSDDRLSTDEKRALLVLYRALIERASSPDGGP